MPETPDFTQIARRIVKLRADLEDEDMRDQIAEQLRLAWNARGAADMRTLEGPVGEIVDAIRSLDR